MNEFELAYVIKSAKDNKYLGFDSRFIIDRETIHGATLFKTKEEAEGVIKYYDDKIFIEGEEPYNPLDDSKPLEIIEIIMMEVITCQ